jgi:inosine-uridine nucleoside N-ribohydrolase
MKQILISFSILCLISVTTFAQKKVWFDTDLMIGLPENKPREVDDAIALLMALNNPKAIKLVGISTITNTEYAVKTAKELLRKYSPTKNIPVFGGSDKANDLDVSNDATTALAKALTKEKLSILAIGPLTNIGTLIKNNPELVSQINEVIVCAGRSQNYPFKLGTGNIIVGDYNFETDVEGFRTVLESGVKMVFAGFESSEKILLDKKEIGFLNKPKHKWLYNELRLWQDSFVGLFGQPAFVAWDTTPVGYLTHPQYFKIYKAMPAAINYRLNEANVGPNIGQQKAYLEVAETIKSNYIVDFVYKTSPNFEKIVLQNLRALATSRNK